jgi:hypothetical protein
MNDEARNTAGLVPGHAPGCPASRSYGPCTCGEVTPALIAAPAIKENGSNLESGHTACLAPDGWKLMPPKLTPEMIEAMWDAMPLTIEGREDDGEATDDGYAKLYLAALTAAPEPSTPHRGSADLTPWLRHVGDCPYADLNLAPSAMERECTCGLVQALTGHQSGTECPRCPDPLGCRRKGKCDPDGGLSV